MEKMGHPQLASAPILYRPSIQDDSKENPIYYLAFRSKITPALQASQAESCAIPSETPKASVTWVLDFYITARTTVILRL